MQIFKLAYKVFIFVIFGCSFSQAAQYNDSNGIVLESNRVIYPEKAKNGITFTVKNHTSFTYLLQSRLVPWPDSASSVDSGESSDSKAVSSIEQGIYKKVSVEKPVPFIVLPPLVRFAPDDDITIKIKLINNELPQDRESIFALSLKAIPSKTIQDDNVGKMKSANMLLALQNNLKFFYRPENLVPMNDDEKTMAMTFALQGNQLTITNPTPYYITLNKVSLDEKPLNLGHQRMIAPLSAQIFNHADIQAKKVSWQIIGDNGRATDVQTQTLS